MDLSHHSASLYAHPTGLYAMKCTGELKAHEHLWNAAFQGAHDLFHEKNEHTQFIREFLHGQLQKDPDATYPTTPLSTHIAHAGHNAHDGSQPASPQLQAGAVRNESPADTSHASPADPTKKKTLKSRLRALVTRRKFKSEPPPNHEHVRERDTRVEREHAQHDTIAADLLASPPEHHAAVHHNNQDNSLRGFLFGDKDIKLLPDVHLFATHVTNNSKNVYGSTTHGPSTSKHSDTILSGAMDFKNAHLGYHNNKTDHKTRTRT
jgi:hypothetical protein